MVPSVSGWRTVERTPALARDAIKRGHEVAAHGWRWQSHAGMNEVEERQTIRRTVSAIELTTGVMPVGWHTRSAASPNTRQLLVEEGFLCDSDAYNDDLPYFVVVGDARDLVIPYSFDTNDMHYQHTQRFRGTDFADYVVAAYDWLVREAATAPKMMSIGLHLRMIGRPGRIGALEKILSHITKSGAAWVAPRTDIARCWLAQFSDHPP